MTNKFAFTLAALIVVLIIIDQILWDGRYLVFLGTKLLDIINYFAFWR